MSKLSHRLARAFVILSMPAALAACATTQPTLRTARGAQEPIAAAEPIGGDASVYGLFLAGETALDQGASRDAAAYFSRASSSAPEADFLKNRAFAAALIAGDIDKAASLAPTAPSSTSANDAGIFALGLLTRATVDLAENRNKEAYALLTNAPTGEHSAAVILIRPWAAAAAGDMTVATAAPGPSIERAVQAFGGVGQALLLERAGRFAPAETAYQAQAVRGGVFALSYGAFLERRGRRAEAIAIYDKGLTKEPTDPAFLTAKARAATNHAAPTLPTIKQGAADALVGPAALLLSAKQGDAGLAYLRLALRLDPTLDEAWVLVGDAMDTANDPAAARVAYGHILPGSPEYTTAQGRLAISLETNGDKAAALALARTTAVAAPDDPQALVVLADLLRDNDHYAESVTVLDKLIHQLGGDTATSWRLYFLRGASEERSGAWDAAQTDLQRSLKLKPNDPEVMNYLGFAWADRGEHLDQALDLLQRATVLSPRSGEIIDSLGWVNFRLGHYHTAVEELELAASLDPADPEVNDHLGDAYWRTGRKLEAKFQWSSVLSLDPDAAMRAATATKLAEGMKPDTTPDPNPGLKADTNLKTTPIASAQTAPPLRTRQP
jgi:tetratricopeptide (TPR) repeat protein